ncbi:MAG: lipopolysaccharide biosynthesis protein [Clostridia bacterium]|nr:lipopolysaccharide biosynthesis protein [Clostridia bacterium]
MNLNRKNVIWNMVGATANAFTSLIFVMIVTFINGKDSAGIFSYGFATALVLFCLANYITRPYQVTDISGRYSDTDYIFVRIFTCAVSAAAGIVFCIIRQYDIYKSAIIILLCIYRIVEALIETYYAVIQKRDLLYKVGISLTVRAVLGVAVFFAVDIITENLVASSAALVAVNILCFLCLDLPNTVKCGIEKSRFSLKASRSLLVAGFFNFILTVLNTLVINISRYAIDEYESNITQAIFGYIIIPATFMNLFGQYVIQPVLTSISAGVKERNHKKIAGEIKKVLLIIALGGVAVTVVAFFLEAPVLSLLFGMDFAPYKWEMMIIIIGSVMYALEVVLSFVLVAFRVTGVQAAIYGVITVLSATLSFAAVKQSGLMGAAVTYAASMMALAVCLGIVLICRLIKFKKDWKGEKL